MNFHRHELYDFQHENIAEWWDFSPAMMGSRLLNLCQQQLLKFLRNKRISPAKVMAFTSNRGI